MEVLQALAALPTVHPGYAHIAQLLDNFTVTGPSGTHSCLVLELLGPSVRETNQEVVQNSTFPSSLVKSVAVQVLQAIDLISSNGIGHGGTLQATNLTPASI